MTELDDMQPTASAQKDKVLVASGSSGSKLFRHNRALGYVSNSIPAVVRYIIRRKDNLITTCIGRSFQVYTASHFRLLHVSDIHPDEITAMATDRVHIYTACDKYIYAWRAGKHRRHIYGEHKRNVHLLLPFGAHLIAVDEANELKVWQIRNEELYLDLPFNAAEFRITAVAHLPTYVNKILLGSEQGFLKLLNLKENRTLYTFRGHASKVTCIQPAPAIDVVAVGHKDGKIVLLNLKYDEELMSFQQDWGAVTQLAFRTDGPPIMASASNNGNMAFWNLEEKRLTSQMQMHEDTVSTAICFPNEPLLLTTSPDNSMKLWIFDLPDQGARMLRIREGHTAPPLCIRFHGSSGTSILSSGEDSSLRVFSTVSETLNKSMGKASYNRKASKKKNRFQQNTLVMPPILEFTTETTREKEWDNIAAIHAGIIQTTTWSFHKSRMGEHRLVPEKFQNKNRRDFEAETTCVTLTHCGNFVIIGYSSGDLERFNIQSGIHRASYGAPSAHKSAVRGVASDNLNQSVISGCSDGFLKFWYFNNIVPKPKAVLKLPEGVALMRCHRESAMLAVALVNFVVFIIDCDTNAIVRKFSGHKAKINDLTFSPDSRWLITAAMDATIKVWDIPSAYMIDHFKTERPCIALSMSPSGDFLATAHVNYLGIYLWSNKTLFNHITLRSIDPEADAPFVHLPSATYDALSLENALEDLNMDVDDAEEDGEEIDAAYISPKQLDSEHITLSGLPAARWQNLLDLEIIKKHNKPKAPPKAPKQAPFFLPTVAGTEFKFDLSHSSATTDGANSRIIRAHNFSNLTAFGKLLEATLQTDAYEACVEHLKQLGPSMIDFGIKSLHPLGGGNYKIMVQFLKTIEHMFRSNANFELGQAYLSAFLRAHGLALLEQKEISAALKQVSVAQEEAWHRIEKKLMFGIGVVAALRNFAH